MSYRVWEQHLSTIRRAQRETLSEFVPIIGITGTASGDTRTCPGMSQAANARPGKRPGSSSGRDSTSSVLLRRPEFRLSLRGFGGNYLRQISGCLDAVFRHPALLTPRPESSMQTIDEYKPQRPEKAGARATLSTTIVSVEKKQRLLFVEKRRADST